MDVPTQARPVVHLPIAMDDDVRLVQRPPPPGRSRDQVELAAERDERIAADPRRLDLPRNEERRDFLIGPARDQLHRDLQTRGEIPPQMIEEFEVVDQEDRREPEPEDLVFLGPADRWKRQGRRRRGEQPYRLPAVHKRCLRPVHQ